MTARVLGESRRRISSGSMFIVRRSISAKTGTAPTCVMTLTVAAKVIGEVITSSPGRTPDTSIERWSPAVQEPRACA